MTVEACVVGCGAVGCLLAGFLHEALGEPPVVVVRRGGQRDVLNREGAVITGMTDMSFPVEAYTPGELPGGYCRYSIVATKAYHAREAVLEAVRISEYTAVASNGFGALEEVERRGGLGIGVIVEYGVVRESDNRVSLRGVGRLIVGPYKSPPGPARGLGGLLARGGARVEIVDDIEPYRWAKAAVSVGLNGVASVLGVENGVVLVDAHARDLALRAAEEVAGVARALGVELPFDASRYLLEVAEGTRLNRNSMLQDIERGRKTEVEEIHGYVLRRARELGVRTVTIEYLYMLLKALEGLGGRVCLRRERR
ncbi:MAG: ketopantoate reductase family protein [Desulfurococcales archaeon]|nr:ketopantoate reductase family protein [Desulfurococcales archaeon]